MNDKGGHDQAEEGGNQVPGWRGGLLRAAGSEALPARRQGLGPGTRPLEVHGH